MSRQFRRLQRIRLKNHRHRAVPADFMARMLAAHHAHPWAGRARGFARRRPFWGVGAVGRGLSSSSETRVAGAACSLVDA